MEIDPWGSNQVQDYARLRDQFGIEAFGRDNWEVFDEPHNLFRRGVVFGHRDFQRISDAVKARDPWGVMTGLMPSGMMHLGHKMVVEQCIAHQKHGADLHIAVADFEAVATRGFTVEKARELARDQYVHNYLALGLKPENAEVYFQTKRNRVRDLADQFARKVNWNEMTKLYGFDGATTLSHVMAPVIQAADILHPQGFDMGGPRPILVPVGVDQDPHIRLTRDIAQRHRMYSIKRLEEGVGIYVKPDTNVTGHLDRAEKVLTDLGFSDWKRNDGYKELKIGGAGRRDMRTIDLALARAEQKKHHLGLLRPAATFHRFMTGFGGGKMSSSQPETSAFLTEEPAVAQKKLMRSVTGGKATAAEQQRDGADPSKCPIYELYLYHLAQSDDHLQQVHDECTGGERLCGGCKTEAAGLLVEFLKSHQEKRDEVEHLIPEIIRED